MTRQWPLPDLFQVRLTMDSDWHVGSGMGRPGDVDRLIVRDADDLPFVPAKTLRGVWRDACERLCRGLDDGQVGAWSCLVDRLFGSQPGLARRREDEDSRDPTGYHDDPRNKPIGSAVEMGAARIEETLRTALKRDGRLREREGRLREAMTFVKPGVKICRHSGSALDKHLRFEEMARVGTVLEARCRLMVGKEMREAVSALLIASAQLIERLGGKRRRGSGRCRLEIVDADADRAIAWLGQSVTPPQWVKRSDDVASPNTTKPTAASDSWTVVPLVLELRGPLAVSYRTAGNVVETLDFLPGSYLLPHITRTLDKRVDVRAAIQAGDMCVLPAMLEVDGERSQPVPLAWSAPKGVTEPLAECSPLVNRLLPGEISGTQLKPLREGYLRPGAPTKVIKTPKVVQTHNTIEDRSQRPTSDVGGVYTYEAIASTDKGRPVRLRSELRLRQSLADQLAQEQFDWWTRLSGEVTLGRSKKDDYGAVIISAEEAKSFASAFDRVESELFVWIVSDTLIRNEQLRPDPTAAALARELARRLGVTLAPRNSDDGRLNELVRIRRLDTWHVGWGLPRPSLVALQAGSCIVFQLGGTVDLARLADIEAAGIGERTAEGYGQVRFNHPLLTQLPEWPAAPQVSDSPPPVDTLSVHADDPTFAFAQRLEREYWKQEIRRACLAIAADPERRRRLLGWDAHGEQGNPPMSQLGGLRGQLARLRNANDVSSIMGWLGHLERNPRRNDRWPGGSIALVRAFLNNPQRIWHEVNCTNWLPLTDGAVSRLQAELWPLAVRTFFDACIRAHKRELEVPSGT
ncbi:MAG: hypothetical protein K2R98_09425 [Gemmataceae bacterium]|nr:hypothetical protein [Gemmataceae bacterium]